MKGSIPDDKIQQMRDGADMFELVSRYVQLKRSGANYVGLCPFHSEKSPSFSVNPGRQIFKCFGCGVGGDAFEFLMKIEGLSFPEAARRIAGEVGVDIEETQLSPEEDRRRQERDRLQRVNAVAAEFFHRQLIESPEAEACRQYLNRRGYGKTSAAEYQLGYAPDRWDALTGHFRQQGVELDDARTLGLIRRRDKGEGDYDLFRGRLIFPIHDLSGRIVAFGGRILGDGQPKYINSTESPIYHKGQVLFGLFGARQAIRQATEVILVEGYFDQLALARAGVGNAVATCGTALTVEHAQLLKRYAKRVLLLFDNDKAGRNATFKAMELLLPGGLETAVIELDEGEDPDSFLQKRGKEAFAERLQAARPVLELYMQEQLASAPANPSGVSRAAQQVLEKLVLLPNPLEVDLSLKELAQWTEIEVDLLRQQLEQVRHQQHEREARSRRSASSSEIAPQVPLPAEANLAVKGRSADKLTPADGKLLKMIIFEKDGRGQVEVQGVDTFFFEPFACRLASELLQQLAGVVPGQELTRLQQRPELLAQLPMPLEYDSVEYAGVWRQMLENNRRKTADKRRRQQVKDL
ncbi:DNA primase [Geopsychrobacter electrodiphilus]|uniref:DNA primase n=1 Tax=Geopsychrobacter electrodiphilus TaxID=225196 RepID=UPI00035D3A17|nr:DNA primase [Geopsychrobacter electrodiphilus]